MRVRDSILLACSLDACIDVLLLLLREVRGFFFGGGMQLSLTRTHAAAHAATSSTTVFCALVWMRGGAESPRRQRVGESAVLRERAAWIGCTVDGAAVVPTRAPASFHKQVGPNSPRWCNSHVAMVHSCLVLTCMLLLTNFPTLCTTRSTNGFARKQLRPQCDSQIWRSDSILIHY